MTVGIPFRDAIETPEWALEALAAQTHPQALETQE